ncbi:MULTISPECIES: hypothetical protein [unclassified Massilia]|uniref:hypothetical protein n=1 Tax=unclassified Massilia TaxID=2609279 RepID=UPI001B83BA52|nr:MULTISPECIES: hypothetical protein [unclassified Massilia]MBQ5941704.1 hypothetical protein [Massilia sp. AB1]MBQ5962885.1 hypothetical protein [Massilia sp. ZL223]
MEHMNRLVRGVCACALGIAALAAQAQVQEPAKEQAQPQAGAEAAVRNTDAAVNPTVARQQAREIAQGDPARWYRDDPTRQAKMKTLQKEIGAALQEAQNACKKRPAAERSACMKEARATWQQDMAQAKAQLDQEQ